jgi:hypothetical protein
MRCMTFLSHCIIPPFVPRLPNCLFPSSFLSNFSNRSLIHLTCPAHLILLDLITVRLVKTTNIEASHFLQPPVTSLLGSNILLSTLYSNTYLLRLKDQFYIHTNKRKIIILYILIFMVLDCRWEDKDKRF